MQNQVALFTSSSESNVTAWSLSTGSQLCSYKGNSSPRNGICLISHQYILAAQLKKGPLHFWSLQKDNVLQRCFASEQLLCVAAHPAGTFVAGGGISGVIYVWEVGTGVLLTTWQPHFKAVTVVAFSPGGSFLASGSEDTQAHIVMLADLLDVTAIANRERVQPLHTWSGHSLSITSLCFGHGEANSMAITASLDRSVKIWSVSQGTLLRSISLMTTAECITLDPTERRLYMGGGNGNVYEINLSPGPNDHMPPPNDDSSAQQHAIFEGHKQTVTCIALTSDATRIVAGCQDGSVRIFEVHSRQVIRVLDNPVKGPLTGILLMDEHLQLATGSGRKGPTRPAPLAPFTKYAGMRGTAKAWEGAPVLLTGGQMSLGHNNHTGDVLGGVAVGSNQSDASESLLAAHGQLQQENARLRSQLSAALSAADGWRQLNTQLQEFVMAEIMGPAQNGSATS